MKDAWVLGAGLTVVRCCTNTRSSACDLRMLKDHCIAGGQYRNQPGDGKELC